jgi:hypothetical protein
VLSGGMAGLHNYRLFARDISAGQIGLPREVLVSGEPVERLERKTNQEISVPIRITILERVSFARETPVEVVSTWLDRGAAG